MVPRKIYHLNFLRRFFLWILHWILRLWYKTLRFDVDAESLETLRNFPGPGQSCVFYFWHNQLFVAPKIRLKYRPRRPMYGLISASKDGAWLESFVSFFNVFAVRGSSSWRGGQALTELNEKLNDEPCDIIITPDGPRGPRYQCKFGSLQFVCEKQLPVVFLNLDMKHFWQLHSWDHFRIPKPFSKVIVRTSKCLSLPSLPKEKLIEYVNEQLDFPQKF